MGRHEMDYPENDDEMDDYNQREPHRDQMRTTGNYAQIAVNCPSVIVSGHN